MAEHNQRGFLLPAVQLRWPWSNAGTAAAQEKHRSLFHLLHSLPARVLNPSNEASSRIPLGGEEAAEVETDGAEFRVSRYGNPALRSIVRKNRFRGLNFSSPQEFGASLRHTVHVLHGRIAQAQFDEFGTKLVHLCTSAIQNNRHKNAHPLENMLHAIGNKLNHLYSECAPLPLLASISSSISKSTPPDAVQEAQNVKKMTPAQISKRLDSVPVYAVSNYSNEFVLVSDINSNKSLGIFCFRQEDAEALLAQVKDREPSLGRGARVVSVSLDKVYQLNAEGIAFRFLPDPRQVRHALEETRKLGDSGKGFDGIPVFLSDNLILKIRSQRLCPIFFSKEDLENALQKAISQQQRTNPNLRVKNEIQVGSFEDVLKKMESNEEESEWGNIVFIPLGMDAKNFLERSTAGSRGT